MTNYVLELADSGETIEINAENDTLAESTATARLSRRFGADVVAAEQWDSDGPGRERLLFWANEIDAENDNGSKAVAVLTVIRDRSKID